MTGRCSFRVALVTAAGAGPSERVALVPACEAATSPQPSASAAVAADAMHTYSPGSSASQVLNNLVHVFTTAAPLKVRLGCWWR